MHRANQLAFKQNCSICKWPRRSIATRELTSARLLGFKYINYRFCEWCDKGNKGKRQ